MMKLLASLFQVFLLLGTLLSGYQIFGQAVIKQVETKEYPQYELRYPYDLIQDGGEFAFALHKPSLRVSEFEFIYVWSPDNKSERTRAIMKYDLLLEEIWRTDTKLEFNEEIVHMYIEDSVLYILSTDYKRMQRQHSVHARKYSIHSGKEIAHRVIRIVGGAIESEILFAHSPDSSKLLFYHYGNSNPKRRHSLSFDFIQNDESIGHRAFSADELCLAVFNKQLESIFEDTLSIPPFKRSKGHAMGCQIDNDGDMYASVFARPNTLTITQIPFKGGETLSLSYDNFPNVWREADIFGARFPPVIGSQSSLYFAIANRERFNGRWQTLGFRVLAFDFEKQEVNADRHVITDATMLVHASKNREAFGLRPSKKFDNYYIREIIEMPNKHLWLFTQKLQLEHLNSYRSFTGGTRYGHRLEEVIIYEFFPNGDFRRAIVMPSIQEANGPELQGGEFYAMNLDDTKGRFQIITHEKDGERLNRQPRTFYREIDIETGAVSERKMIYKGRRETQLFFKAYTVWLNSNLVVMLQEDGYQDRTYLVSVDLNGEPEEKKKRKKRKKTAGD